MNRELDAQLVKDHPLLFASRRAGMRTTAMCWGFECGDGWYELLKEAADKLEPMCREIYEKEAAREKPYYKYIRNAVTPFARWPKPFNVVGSLIWKALYKTVDFIQPNVYGNAIYYFGEPPCRASQVKEKFGTLRFYMTSQTQEMDVVIKEAERKSAITCEQCGKKGKLYSKGWCYTACAVCNKKRGK